MKISIIAAVSRNQVIGAGNRMPWHLPEDLKRFKQLTMGKPVVMGRKTFCSIGKILPGRLNIVITRRPDFRPSASLVAVDSLSAAWHAAGDAEEVFVIGGGEIYAQTMAAASRLYLTEVDADFDGDVFLPPISAAWRENYREKGHGTGGLQFSFVDYKRCRADDE